ncbi:MAG TPA: HNH endonuclease, partial [Bacteroidales bacterium]|nr:HNH endonuclease [Bacteroidales bacterium]
YLWHRLLFRAADELANLKLISRPTQTLKLTNKREWMLLEKGFDKAMKLLDIPEYKKEFLPIKSYEVQKIVKKLTEKSPPSNYQPFDKNRKISKVNRTYSLRKRGFRQAVMEAYDYKCAICGLKLNSPNLSIWEVEAAHIVPHSVMGKDDLWNGISLCRFHHWAFDVGWFTILSDYTVKLSNRYKDLPKDYGRVLNFDFLGDTVQDKKRIILPNRQASYPHQRSIRWHQQNVFNNERD